MVKKAKTKIGMTKRSKLLGYYYAETVVDFKGIQVKLFFCKSYRKGNWNGMMQYNLLSVVKRFNDYETLGELFRSAQKDSLEITIAEQI